VADWVHFPGAHYVEVDGDQEVAPGVHLFSTPGHTPGHQSVVIETDDGPVVIAGQAIYSAAEFAHIRATGTLQAGDEPADPEAYLASALRMVALDATAVLFSHDEVVLRHQR
jgi:N-acyl homoserine lactone hydrolase